MATPNSTREETIKELKHLKSEGSYDAMLAAAQRAVVTYPDEGKAWDLLHYAQAHYVNEKLESQIVKQLEEKGDNVSLTQVYLKLLTIFPESNHLKKLLQKTRRMIQVGHEKEVENFYKNAELKIKEMVEKGALEEAIQASHEILDREPTNKTFYRLLIHAEHLLDEQMNNELTSLFKEEYQILKEEYKGKPEKFIKI